MSRTLLFLSVVACCASTDGAAIAQVRPQAGRAQVAAPAVPKKLQDLLVAWYKNTRGIKRLHGHHTKYVYNLVFSLETRGVGRFYYESPDKGRIDIFPADIGRNAVSDRLDRNKRPFALKAAQADQWISNGKKIYQIDPKKKTGTMFPIPEKAQGRNIMDGPLPFLLGMPPAKAVQRYNLTIEKETRDKVWLVVEPKWPSDRKNYKLAKVILQKDNHYLPYAVQMFAPSGNQETVYVFTKMTVNPLQLPFPFNKQPFKDALKGVKISAAIPKTPRGLRRPIPVKRQPNQLPVLTGHKWQDAKAWLEKSKLKVRFIKGSIATNAKTLNRVESQFPKPFTVFKPGQTVYLAVHVHPKMHKPADYAVVPDTSGMFHEKAKQTLKEFGFDVEFRKGSIALNQRTEHCVQHQFPAAKVKAVKGTKVLLVLYLKPSDLKPRVRTSAKPR
ncbi:MAG: PASTA domain-containing protein [Planctomycetaceae bacterium]